MVQLSQLVIPIFLSAVLVFIASSLIHMVLKWHNKDYGRLSNEDEVRGAINRGNPAPGQYIMPWAMDPSAFKDPEFQKKFTEGPIATLYIKASGLPRMGPQLGGWFVFNIVVSVFVAYLTSRTVPQGTEYLRVFQVAGTAGFLSYSMGVFPMAIWMGKPWSVAIKEAVDGLIYGCMIGGAFGWLWPR